MPPLDVKSLSVPQLESLLRSQQVSGFRDHNGDRVKLVEEVMKLSLPLSMLLIRSDLKDLMRAPHHDDGSYAPLFIRMAWHNSGTWDKNKGNGGSNGCTFRFPEEKGDPENAGLDLAAEVLAPVHEKYSFLSLADMFILAGCVAIESTGGPFVPFAYGRRDFTSEEAADKYGPSMCPFGDGLHNSHGSRLPEADRGTAEGAPQGCPMHVKEKATIDGVRSVFDRLGFTDREAVCLILLGHMFGRCHLDTSGYEFPWYSFGPTSWSAYEHGLGYLSVYRMAVARGQSKMRVTGKGKRQWEVAFGGGIEPFMMLPSDMALWWDEKFRVWVEYYDDNRKQFRLDAVRNFKRLVELGCEGILTEERPFPPSNGGR
jgi:catalase (peroxidase I)